MVCCRAKCMQNLYFFNRKHLWYLWVGINQYWFSGLIPVQIINSSYCCLTTITNPATTFLLSALELLGRRETSLAHTTGGWLTMAANKGFQPVVWIGTMYLIQKWQSAPIIRQVSRQVNKYGGWHVVLVLPIQVTLVGVSLEMKYSMP